MQYCLTEEEYNRLKNPSTEERNRILREQSVQEEVRRQVDKREAHYVNLLLRFIDDNKLRMLHLTKDQVDELKRVFSDAARMAREKVLQEEVATRKGGM